MACDKNIRWGGGFIEKKLVVDEKQTEQSCSFTLKKLWVRLPLLLCRYLILALVKFWWAVVKKKNVLFSGGFGCLLWVLGSGVWGQIASVPACWIGNDSGGSWCELRMPVHLSLGCFLPHYHELWHGTRALACFPFDDSQIWVNTL